MNRLLLAAALYLPLTFAAIAPLTAAQPIPVPTPQERLVRSPYTPHALAFAAYRGRLAGIPSFDRLATCFLFGEIKAEDLVQAAIAQGRLTEEHLANQRFLRDVERSLRPLLCATCH
ncbi:MAG: hypothetical protein AAFY11_00460 [Cyanobacteria bacterium J06641_5]